MFTAQILLRNAGQCGVTHAHDMAWPCATIDFLWFCCYVVCFCQVCKTLYLSMNTNLTYIVTCGIIYRAVQLFPDGPGKKTISTVSPLFIKVHQLWVEAFSADYSKHRAVCKVSCIARQETKNILCCSEWFEELVVTCHLSTSQM